MAYSGIAANASSHSAIFSHSSPFLAPRRDYGLRLPQPLADASPVVDCDVLSEETGFFDDGSFCFDDDEEDAPHEDVEPPWPVEEKAPPSIFASGSGTVPTHVSSARGPIYVRTTGSSPDNGRASQSLNNACEKPSSRPLKPDLGSRPVDIVSTRTSTFEGSKNCKESGKKVMSVRESLLVEAWERKRDHKHHDEMSMEMQVKKPEQYGRSVSDTGKLLVSPTEGSKIKLRARSLTDDDFDELRGFMDLGFRFSEDCIPHLCDTLPALEVYCAIKQTLQDSPCHGNLHGVPEISSPVSSLPSPTSSWKVASPGDQPQDVKARLKLWAHAVACDLRQSY